MPSTTCASSKVPAEGASAAIAEHSTAMAMSVSATGIEI